MNTALAKHLFSLLLFGSNGIVASRIDLTSYEIVFLLQMRHSAPDRLQGSIRGDLLKLKDRRPT